MPGGGDGSEQEGPVTPKIKKGAKDVCNEIERMQMRKVLKERGLMLLLITNLRTMMVVHPDL